MRDRTVRPGEEELFKSRARERGTVKLIDIITTSPSKRRTASTS
jgi:ATP-dependent Lon protease